MTTFNTNPAGLAAAMASAVGGDTVNLAAGSYGNRTFTQDYAGSHVHLISTPARGAVFGDINFAGSSYIDFSQCSAGHVAWDNYVTNHHIKYNDGTMTSFALAGSGVQHDIDICRNVIGPTGRAQMCLILGNSYNVLFEENEVGDVANFDPAAHTDLLQMFASFDPVRLCPHHITIRRNKFCDNPATGIVIPQGLFISDPGPIGYKHMLVEENVFEGAPYRSLSVSGFNLNCIVRNNTILGGNLYLEDLKGANSDCLVQNNVCPGISQEGAAAATLSNNLILSSGQIATMFPTFTTGIEWSEYIPAAGTIAVGRGADYDGLWLRTKGGAAPDQPPPDPPPPIPDPILPNPAPGAGLRVRFL